MIKMETLAVKFCRFQCPKCDKGDLEQTDVSGEEHYHKCNNCGRNFVLPRSFPSIYFVRHDGKFLDLQTGEWIDAYEPKEITNE